MLENVRVVHICDIEWWKQSTTKYQKRSTNLGDQVQK
jgi:hypothetical protein